MAAIIFGVSLSICGVALLVCFYILIRNEWVCKNRIDLIWRDIEAYERAPSYDAMLYGRPFCWDFAKLSGAESPAQHAA